MISEFFPGPKSLWLRDTKTPGDKGQILASREAFRSSGGVCSSCKLATGVGLSGAGGRVAGRAVRPFSAGGQVRDGA